MTLPALARPARRALHRRHPNGALWLAIGLSLTGLCFTHAALAAGPLPQGGTFVAGTGAITSRGNVVVITQPGSTRGVIEWNSFSIGRNNSVTFDNGAGATLNRVIGGSPSAILGKLTATGSLYVINPQGIVVGPAGVISTGGRFVASTLDICNCAFMQGGNALTLSGDSNANVINLGRISSSGGDVFLIARRAVINAGAVSAPNGTAELAAGENILLQDSNDSRQVFVRTGSQGTVVNRGRIEAAQISLQAADGNVYALAGGGTRIRATGTANRDGHVWLVADGGRVAQYGRIAASDENGNGGAVDTQAAQLGFGKHAAVHARQWYLSTPTFIINDAAAHALQRSLSGGTSIEVTTTGANGTTGDLRVASSLRWSGSASLTLAAYHSVSLTTGATVANNGAGNLTLRADAASIDNSGSVINNGTIDWSKSTGTVSVLYDMNGTYSQGIVSTNNAWSAAPYSGLLTQVTGYKLVNTLTDLQNVSLDVAGTYALGKDIDAGATWPGVPTAVAFRPIGDGATPFAGQFDGMGHKITSLWILDPYAVVVGPGNGGAMGPEMSLGLFGDIGTAGVVRNLTVDGVTGQYLVGDAGMLAGVNHGSLVNTHTSGSVVLVYGIGTNVGGLVGWNDGSIARSSSDATASGQGYVGGLVGVNQTSGNIRQSFATGEANSFGHGFGGGGLVGSNAGQISQSYATGSVSYQPDFCDGHCFSNGGGLVFTNAGTITQSFATGALTPRAGFSPQPAGIANTNRGVIAGDVFWNAESTGTDIGVLSGTPIPAANGLTTAQMSQPASFGPTYDFGANGVWAIADGALHPLLQWQTQH